MITTQEVLVVSHCLPSVPLRKLDRRIRLWHLSTGGAGGPRDGETVLCVCCPGQVGAEVVPPWGVWGVKVSGVEEEEVKAGRELIGGGVQSLSNLNVYMR